MAGYYQVYYPLPGYGPLATIVGPSGNPWTSPYAYDAWAGRYGGGGISQDQPFPPFQTMPGTGSVDANGQITVTFVWVKTDGDDDDTPPPYVLIIKDSTASWTGDSGNCANGLGDPEVSGSSSGIHYELYANPPEQFTRTVTPVVHAVADDPPIIAEHATGSVSIRYFAVPIEIKLTGVLNADTDRRLMIGQELGAYVSIGGLTMGNDPTYSWNVSGGNPFQSFDVKYTFPESATVTMFAPQTTQTLSTHLRTPTLNDAKFTVSCSFYWPWLGQTLNLTEDGKSEKPSAATGVAIVLPETYFYDEPTLTFPNVVRLRQSNPYQPGIIWSGIVTTPTEFRVGGAGHWAIVQLVANHRVWDGLVPYDSRYDDPEFPDVHVFAVNDRIGLDASFTYGLQTFTADGSPDSTNDSPSQEMSTSDGFHYTHAFDSFDTYYFYRPPGANSKWVPLKKLDWYWKAHLHHTGWFTDWVWEDREAMWGYSGDFPPHPTWICRHETASWVWDVP